MNSKLAAVLCLAAAAVTCIAVFLPWFSISVSGLEMGREMGIQFPTSQTANGTEGDFHGVAILILCLLGAAGAGLFAGGLTELVPMTGKQLLFLATTLFAVAAVLTFLDVTKDLGTQGGSMAGVTIKAGKDFGLYLTQLAVIWAMIFAGLAAVRVKDN